jgi:hypothetical protein
MKAKTPTGVHLMLSCSKKLMRNATQREGETDIDFSW